MVHSEAVGVVALQGDPCAAGEVHGQVEAVNQRDVLVVLGATTIAYSELGQRRQRLPRDIAGECTGVVVAASAAIEGTEGAAQDPAGAVAGRHVECPRLAQVEPRAAANWDGRRPHHEAAAVVYAKGGRAGTGGERCEEEEVEASRRPGMPLMSVDQL